MSITNDSFIFFWGFYKTFNRTEHAFIFKALELCGFGDNLRNIIKCFNNGTNPLDCHFKAAYSIPIKTNVKYLGVHITKD